MFGVFMLKWMENIYSTSSLRSDDSSFAILLLAIPTFAIKEPCSNFWEPKTCVVFYSIIFYCLRWNSRIHNFHISLFQLNCCGKGLGFNLFTRLTDKAGITNVCPSSGTSVVSVIIHLSRWDVDSQLKQKWSKLLKGSFSLVQSTSWCDNALCGFIHTLGHFDIFERNTLICHMGYYTIVIIISIIEFEQNCLNVHNTSQLLRLWTFSVRGSLTFTQQTSLLPSAPETTKI